MAPLPGVHLGSPEFLAGGPMPREVGSERVGGKNQSPFLTWEGKPPEGTRSWALAMVDTTPPGRGFVHWLVVDIPASARGLTPSASETTAMPAGAVELANGTGSAGYAGPAPPSGTHLYRFVLYAMPDATTGLAASSDASAFFGTVSKALGAVTLGGTYIR